MIKIKQFTASDIEFNEIARVRNLINHDSIDHPDYDKDDWKARDKSLIRDRLMLYNKDESFICQLAKRMKTKCDLLLKSYGEWNELGTEVVKNIK